jgi:pyruvate-ferredoxin/flavodoxin oxidoreductase
MPGLANSTERGGAFKRPAKYPGIRTAADGSEAVVWVERHLSQAAYAYGVPPSNRMTERFEREVARGRRNAWDEPLEFHKAESAYGAASMCEGFALAGGRVTTFTGGQGLVQMAEVLHTAAGKRLPMVFHVAATALSSQAMTIQAGHDDLAAVTDCGWGILIARNAQEAADLAVIARRAAELAETPFLNVQDGFVTTHGLETVHLPEPELMKVFVGAPDRRVRNVFNTAHPLITSPLENQDSYMRGRIAQRFFYERVRPSLDTAMSDFTELTGRRYGHLRCHRMEDAEFAIVGMGSLMDSADVAVEHLRAQGVRVGSLAITTLRPFPSVELVTALARCRAVTVIERTDRPLAAANPVTEQLKAALAAAQMGEDTRLLRVPEVYSGTAGVGGRAVTPAALVAAIENMTRNGRRAFVLGIKHPDALNVGPEIDARPHGSYSLRIHSRAGFGSTATARFIATLASDLFGVEVQVESSYTGEERVVPVSATVTLAPRRLQAHADPPVVDIVTVHDNAAFGYGDPLTGLRTGGTLILETGAPLKEVWGSLPVEIRRSLRERNIDLFTLDAALIAREISATPDRAARARGMALAGAFLKVSPWRNQSGVSEQALAGGIERTLARLFEHRGEGVIAEAKEIVRRGYTDVRVVIPPEQIGDYQTPALRRHSRNSLHPVGDADLVPAGFCDQVLQNYVDGRDSVLDSDLYVARSVMPAGSAQFRSFRQLAAHIPRFSAKNCTGCMECVNLCPDSAIFARVVDAETIEHAPPEIHAQFSFTAKYYDAYLKKGEAGGLFGLYIDADRCKGCGECADVCSNHKALEMVSKAVIELELYDRAREFFENLPDTPPRFINQKSLGDIMLSARTRLHTGGAGSCTGCGESSAIRMLLAGTGFQYGADQIGIVAASGCHTAAWSTYPFTPLRIAWTNTLAANAPSDAIGIRMKWDRDGQRTRRLWVVGSEDALMAAGLSSFETLLDAGLDIKVLVLDKSSRSPIGDLGVSLLMRRDVLVAQTTAAHVNHFYKCVMAANEFAGPAVVICYSACTTDHGIADNHATAQARLAVDSRAFPIFLLDPRAGDRIRERLDLRGNPALRDDWFKDPKTLEPVDFLTFARTEGRFAAHFNPAGEPDTLLKAYSKAALMNWRHLQEAGGLR